MKVLVETPNGPVEIPPAVIRSRLLFAGLGATEIENVLSQFHTDHKHDSEESFNSYLEEIVDEISHQARQDLQILNAYSRRRADDDVDPLIIVLEGASATGKSMLALDAINYLATTRIIGTDTIRQVLRSVHSRNDYPELFCHTYQAHKYKQSGPENLSKELRGFIAQYEIIAPFISRCTSRILAEGAEAVIEGVHIVPGDLQNLSNSVIEILIHPSIETHRSMFISKHTLAKLKTVSREVNIRDTEFSITREIQDYMRDLATDKGIQIINLEDYEAGSNELRSILIAKMRGLH